MQEHLNFEWAKIGNLLYETICSDPDCDSYLEQTGHEYAYGEPVVVVPHSDNSYAPWAVFCIDCASKWDNYTKLAFTRNYQFQNPWAKRMTRLDPRFGHQAEIITTEMTQPKACTRHGFSKFYSPAHEDHLCSQCEDHSKVGRALYDHYAHLSVEVHKDNEITRKRGVGHTPTSIPSSTEENAYIDTVEQLEENKAKAAAEEKARQKRASTRSERSKKRPTRS